MQMEYDRTIRAEPFSKELEAMDRGVALTATVKAMENSFALVHSVLSPCAFRVDFDYTKLIGLGLTCPDSTPTRLHQVPPFPCPSANMSSWQRTLQSFFAWLTLQNQRRRHSSGIFVRFCGSIVSIAMEQRT